MDEKEYQAELKKLQDNLEGKTSKEIKAEIKAFEEKYNAYVEKKAKELIGEELKTFRKGLETEYKEAIRVVQEHANKLDVKLQAKSKKSEGKKDELKAIITDNFEAIKTVRKGKAINLETKVVGDMTLPVNLTGDQPRDYSNVVAVVPSQMLNVADLVQGVNIEGGTYTFPRETGSEGAIAAQVEGASKSQIDYDLTMVDANTDFIAGFAVYSKKMANNLPFLESFLPNALRRDYWKAENSTFNGILAAGATASVQIITGKNKVEMLINELATLEALNYAPNAIVVSPTDFYNILVTEKSTGAGYGLPGLVTYENGQMRINGIPVFKATWLIANKYYVGDFTTAKKIITQGLGVEFSSEDSDNFQKNNITARVESQVTLTLERPDSIIYGDFTAI